MITGHYDRPVTLQSPSVAASAIGANAGGVTWRDEVSGWARIEPLSGRERLVGAGTALGASMAVRITMPWSPQVGAAMADWRVRAGGLVYAIVSVANKAMQNEEVEFACEAGIREA